MPKFAF